MRKLRVLVLLHPEDVPPESAPSKIVNQSSWKPEYSLVKALQKLGHMVETLGVLEELAPIREKLIEFKPSIVFNMLEEFAQRSVYDQNVVSYLQLAKVPYTGNSPRGLIIARDKALTKKILSFHRVPVPSFQVFPKNKKIRPRTNLPYPMIVKSLIEESSLGISQASVVSSSKKLIERVQFIHETIDTAAIAEQYIEGREIYVGVLGNERLQVFNPWELNIDRPHDDAHLIATSNIKHSLRFQKRFKVSQNVAKDLSPEVLERLIRLSKRTYRALYLSGYARIDFRLTAQGVPYVLEANPNPDIDEEETMALAAKHDGLSYPEFLQKILQCGLSRSSDIY